MTRRAFPILMALTLMLVGCSSAVGTESPGTSTDGSAIDEFGIWYYANDTVRGADLAPLFRYQPGPEGLPALFGPVRP